MWEIPGPETVQSGGVVSGWACAADLMEVPFNGKDWLHVAYGTSRLDTADQCGHDRTGFGMTRNWGNRGDGEHDACLRFDDGEAECRTVNVVTVGEPFARGLAGRAHVPDFPAAGSTTVLE